jgi:hypothetical protein
VETAAVAIPPAPPPVLDVQDAAEAAEAAEQRAEAHADVVLAADELELRAGEADEPPGIRALEESEMRAADLADYSEPRESIVFEAPGPGSDVEPPGADVPAAPAERFAPATPAEARLGAEGLGRLRARYAEVMARIAEKPMDEPAREELKTSASRLNPDAWVTADEVSAALEQYETVFESLRAVVGRHPPRRRRR